MSSKPERWNPMRGYPIKWHTSRPVLRTGMTGRPHTTRPLQGQFIKLNRPTNLGKRPPYAPMGRGRQRRELTAGGHFKYGQMGNKYMKVGAFQAAGPIHLGINRPSAMAHRLINGVNFRYTNSSRRQRNILIGGGAALGLGAVAGGAYALHRHRTNRRAATNHVHVHRAVNVRRGAHGRFAGSY